MLCGAAVSVVAWIVVLCHEKGFRPFAGVTRFVRGLPWGGRLALLPLFMALVVYGSTKMESKSTVEVEEKMDEVHPSVGNLGLDLWKCVICCDVSLCFVIYSSKIKFAEVSLAFFGGL